MSTPSAGGEARRPTMADVARIAGVSLKTVSRVVNNVPTVDPQLAVKVNAAVAELGFRRNDMARNLRAGSSSATVGLLIEDLGNPFYAGIAAAAAQYALDRDTLLITASSEEDADRERKLLLELCERRVDGLLVVPAADADHVYLRPEIERGTPIVFLDRPPRNLRADTVLIDNAAGARTAIEHLAAAGHTRIGVVADWLSISTMAERLAAAEKALEQAGLPYRPDLIKYGVHTVADATAAVNAMLDGPEPPTAVFALNNRLVLGALSALNGRSTKVELVGFDDFETAAFVPWPLTVVSYDVREIGRIGAQLLFDRIAGDRSRPKTIVVPTELVVRSAG
ncbi:LacI family DNA-binding transcriptional regulator [Catenulispora rubra]|uniref:LacI family DNA-binding transcriptional regulator n=1 Tax=Catenulispora rubra TaxID=280293 RepID=UPI001E3EFDC1|nr:LacI family DNA-binding transcriptional regulator [Catenulispora rubra]